MFVRASILRLAAVAAPLAFLIASMAEQANAQTDLLPPTAPTNLTATVASCGQVNLSWNPSTDEVGGSGLKAYSISRTENGYTRPPIVIGAVRTSFSDTNEVKASTTAIYSVVAEDYAGNKSFASNQVSVTTPPCPVASGETVIDNAYLEPLGKTMATYGTRTVILYVKMNLSRWDTWISVTDSDSGQASRFLLHSSPGYYQIESDYVLTSATDLWALSWDASTNGKVVISQYKLNGSPPTSATLVSTKAVGDSNSTAASLIRLRSGGLMAAWYQMVGGSDLAAGFAYRSPGGQWSVKYPVNIQNSGGGTMVQSQWAMVQHPADGSIWAFLKRDSFGQISALHFTEVTNDILTDWISPSYISGTVDGDYGPEIEFPFLAVAADPTRNAILLAYQSRKYAYVFIDPVFYNSWKEAYATVASIGADGSKVFIPFPSTMERAVQFGMSVLADGTIWLAYQPINHQTLAWNEVYASKYESGAWSAPALAGRNFQNYVNGALRNPGYLLYRSDQPQVAFLAPDQKVHAFTVSVASPATSDTAPPTTSILTPSAGATVSGTVSVGTASSDNVGVVRVDLLVDGALEGSMSVAPFTFSWDTSRLPAGNHSLQAIAYDAAGNSGASATISVTVQGTSSVDTVAPGVSINSPTNGSTVLRNKSITVSAVASDNVGVSRVNFYANNSLLGSDSSAPYSYNWKVPAKSNIVYTLKAIAYDQAGNSSTAAITVTSK